MGKTTTARSFIQSHPAAHHLSASALLKEAHNQDGEELRTAEKGRLVSNQGVLRDQLDAEASRLGAKLVLLDAHSVVDNDNGLVEIPVDVISSLDPDLLLFLHAPVELISQRRKDDSRPRPHRSIEELERHQRSALTVCERYREQLGTPLIVLQSGDTDGFAAAISTLM